MQLPIAGKKKKRLSPKPDRRVKKREGYAPTAAEEGLRQRRRSLDRAGSRKGLKGCAERKRGDRGKPEVRGRGKTGSPANQNDP